MPVPPEEQAYTGMRLEVAIRNGQPGAHSDMMDACVQIPSERRSATSSGVAMDLGCGAGVPTSRDRAAAGYRVTGPDI